ncbi:MAG: serine/threonine protein kinase [Magnetococcales bacterium]|nr:serine/threonine protein kinase [Magnetococcales bacterium]
MNIPDTIGRWRILPPEGEEAHKGILRGTDPSNGRIVAIKTVPFHLWEDETRHPLIARLRHEAIIIPRLSHPHIITLIDHGEEAQIPYLVLDWHSGATLRDLIVQGPRPGPVRAVNLIRQTLDALDHIHAQGLTHGDLKPGNLLLTPDGDICITDFGAARQLASPYDPPPPSPALVTGTHGYMPPEQLMGQKIDRRADLFATGVILHELLLGRKPFRGGDSWEITRLVLTAAPIRPEPEDPTLPAALIAVLQQALAKRPRDRFQSAREFLQALDSIIAAA